MANRSGKSRPPPARALPITGTDAALNAGEAGTRHMPSPGSLGTAPLPADLKPLTSIRLVLALAVALFHYQLQWAVTDAEVSGLVGLGYLGVDAFFILSGFILLHVYHRDVEEGRYNHARFLLARFARVYPMHIAALGFVLVMVLAAGVLGAGLDESRYSWPALLWSLSLTHAWWPNGEAIGDWNGPSWSLSAEWFAYLAFPIFAWVACRLRRKPFLLLAVAGLLFVGLDFLYRSAFGAILPHAQDTMGVLRIIPEFLYGAALYRLAERWVMGRRAAWTAVAASSLLLLIAMQVHADPRVVVVLAGPVILFLAVLTRAGGGRALSQRWMLVGGEASYAFYLLHMPILTAWKNILSMVRGVPSSYPLQAWEVVVLLALTAAAALAGHHLIERPARLWIKRLGERSSRPRAAASLPV